MEFEVCSSEFEVCSSKFEVCSSEFEVCSSKFEVCRSELEGQLMAAATAYIYMLDFGLIFHATEKKNILTQYLTSLQ